jgi:mRNA interferase MazF
MTAYNMGDIVLIDFPHTDTRSVSKRPAMVLYDSGDQDVIVARITSQEYLMDTDYFIPGWKESGLLIESYVRLGKLATIEKSFITRKLGRLDATDMSKVKAILTAS